MMPLPIEPLTPEQYEYMDALIEVNTDKGGKAIAAMMREAFPRTFSDVLVQKRVRKLSGPKLIIPTKARLEDFLAFVAANSRLSFNKIAPMYAEKSGIPMDGKRAVRWFKRAIKQ